MDKIAGLARSVEKAAGAIRRNWQLAVLIPAAAFHLFHWAATPPITTGRFSTYMQPASEFLERGTYRGVETLRRPPVYPLFLAGALNAAGDLRAAMFLQHILALLTALLAMRITLALWDSRAAAAAAGAIIAFHPDTLYYAGAVESELLAVFLLSLMLWLLVRLLNSRDSRAGPYIAAGLTGGAAALCRPELAACALPPLLFLARGPGGPRRALLFFMPFAVLVGLWMTRNLAVFGYFSLSPMGAITSLQTSGHLIDWDAPSHREFKELYRGILDERGGDHRAVVNMAIDRWPGGTREALLEAAHLGTETVLAHPFKYLLATGKNFADFFRMAGNAAPEEGAAYGLRPTGLIYLALLGLAAGACLGPGPGLGLLALCGLAVTAANCVVEIGIGRRGFEILPLLAILASCLVAAAVSAWNWRRRPGHRDPAL